MNMSVKYGWLTLILAGTLMGASLETPFQKKSNQELVEMAGKVDPQQVPDYKIELYKRMQKMKPAQKKAFHEQLSKAADRNTQDMTMGDFEKRREAIAKAMKERIAKMTRAQFKASGLYYKACGCHGKCHCDVVGPCNCGAHHKKDHHKSVSKT
ncbi:DUF1104 domain-containing protein [Helicobacter vulpis]|uniref:DUF1104 domain-containing protein n=1 Tax=Helicobacter vulpis TaxID=2316076 RepID=UPI001F3EDC73|nr:DUF1104 domain-containing protein [Helicobacter vulpis]